MRRRLSTETGAWCATCKQMHPKTAFGRDKNMADGLARECKAVVSVRNHLYHSANAVALNQRHKRARTQRRAGPQARLWAVKRLVAEAKRRAVKRDWQFDLLPDDLLMPDICPLLGITLIYQAISKRAPGSASLDRIDSSCGYTRENCWIISWRANQLKSDGTSDELRRIADGLDIRVGKKAAGRLLDGREWNEMPGAP